MAEYKIQGETLTAIADAIRSKVGAAITLTPAEMAGAIEAVQLQEKTVTPNTTKQIVTPDANYYGLSSVTVEAVEAPELPSVLDYPFGTVTEGEENGVETRSITTGALGWYVGGYEFVPKEDISVVGFYVYWIGSVSYADAGIFDANGTLLVSKRVNGAKEGAEVRLDQPVRLTAGNHYTVAAYVNGRQDGYISNMTMNPRITYVTGRYNQSSVSSLSYPTGTQSNKILGFTDIILVPAGVFRPEELSVGLGTMNEIADEVIRISGATRNLSVSEMQSELEAVVLQEKTVTPSSDVQEIVPDSGYYGLSKVTVNAAEGTVLPDNAHLYYVGTAASTWNIAGTIFNSTASGAIS